MLKIDIAVALDEKLPPHRVSVADTVELANCRADCTVLLHPTLLLMTSANASAVAVAVTELHRAD